MLYALAISYDSLSFALWGRILVGFGSAEVVNRQVISTCVSFQFMTKASALFVTASAVGMSLGPLIAACLDAVAGRDTKVDLQIPFMPEGGIIYDNVTAPGILMAFLWCIQIVLLLILFREPIKINGEGYAIKGHGREPESEAETVYGTSSISKQVDIESNQRPPASILQRIVDESGKVYQLVFQNPALPVRTSMPEPILYAVLCTYFALPMNSQLIVCS